MSDIPQPPADDKPFVLHATLEYLDFEQRLVGLKVGGKIPPMGAGAYVLVRSDDFNQMLDRLGFQR